MGVRGEPEFRRDVWAYTRGLELPAATIDSARTHVLLTMDLHMELAERELKAGARVVSFPEANPSITRAEEDEYIAAAARLARASKDNDQPGAHTLIAEVPTK